MTDLTLLVSDLQRDEGWRSYLYDDATGGKIGPGSFVHGNPTIGYGFALNVAPFTIEEATPILRGRASAVIAALAVALPWMGGLSEPRQRALGNMAYNMGVAGLLKFDTFLGLMKQGKFGEAADDLEKTAWYSQVGDRAKRIVQIIRTGA